MPNSISAGLSRQMALQAQMEVVSNNIANMNTPGYRGQNMVFQEYIADPKGIEDPLSMVLDYGHFQSTAPGPMTQTGGTFDVALQGKGYFGIQTPEGIMYTRAGNFQVNVNGELVTGRGDLVADEGGGTITIPGDAVDINIAEDGSILTEDGAIGRLMVAEFDDEQTLEAMGNGLYRTDSEAKEATNSRVMQGILESSNVNAVTEMTRMIELSRAYQRTQNLLQGEHERERSMIQRLSRNN